MTNKPLKIALVWDSLDGVEPWMQRLALRVSIAQGLELSALVVREVTETEHPKPALGCWWKLESKLAARPKMVNVDEFQKATTSVPVIDSTDTEAIRAVDADVILDLTYQRGIGLGSELSRFGIWVLDMLGPTYGHESVRAIVSRTRLIDLNLCRLSAETAEADIIGTATLNTKFIAALNHLYLCEKSVTLILRELNRLRLRRKLEVSGSKPLSLASSLSFATVFKYGTHLCRELIARTGTKIGSKLGLRPGMFYLQTGEASLENFTPARMTPQPVSGNTYYADPFLWNNDGEIYCFFEIYDYKSSHGHLGVGRMEDGILTDTRSIIKSDYHMSYPFLFEHDDQLYMMPETCGAKRVELWKCVEFPDRWERDRTLLDDVIAADSSIVEINDEWWLFTNISTDPFGEMNSELHVYKIDGPGLKTLDPHPLNPVVFDSQTARNGGRVHHNNGAVLRASQNNSRGLYGYGLNLMKIDEISMTEYTETLERAVKPDFMPGLIGCHHIDIRDELVVIDVRKRLGGRAS